MDEKKPRDYKKATIITVVLTVAALAGNVFFPALRPESAVPTQGTPAESISSYYTPKPTSSQETTASPIIIPFLVPPKLRISTPASTVTSRIEQFR